MSSSSNKTWRAPARSLRPARRLLDGFCFGDDPPVPAQSRLSNFGVSAEILVVRANVESAIPFVTASQALSERGPATTGGQHAAAAAALDAAVLALYRRPGMGAESRLAELGIELPGMLPAVGNYLPLKRAGDLLYVSGHGPLALDRVGHPEQLTDGFIAVEDALPALIRGKVGTQISLEEAVAAARTTGLLMLAAVRAELASLDRVVSIVKVFGMVNCAPGFNQTPAVIDGCSDLLVEIFGDEIGRHARSAVGMAELPLDIPVEIEMIVHAG